jgi:hypothetical protein
MLRDFSVVLWIVVPRILVGGYGHFRETVVSAYKIAWCHGPEGQNLNYYLCECPLYKIWEDISTIIKKEKVFEWLW